MSRFLPELECFEASIVQQTIASGDTKDTGICGKIFGKIWNGHLTRTTYLRAAGQAHACLKTAFGFAYASNPRPVTRPSLAFLANKLGQSK
jgi:hypothetical protein